VVTILVSGSGTAIGKTQVTAALARVAFQHGRDVQIIKPVQTGVAAHEPSDADLAAKLAGLPSDCAHTLRRYRAALAPISAALAEGSKLKIKTVIREVLALPPTDIRLIEGAGGVAVGLGLQRWDWVEFADAVHADAVVLVVKDKLGAINLSRLVYSYCGWKSREDTSCGVFLNAVTTPPSDVAASTRWTLGKGRIPLWGELACGSLDPVLHYSKLKKWLVS
jgi:dethiobiotin synthase